MLVIIWNGKDREDQLKNDENYTQGFYHNPGFSAAII